jgi:hypothetical protein
MVGRTLCQDTTESCKGGPPSPNSLDSRGGSKRHQTKPNLGPMGKQCCQDLPVLRGRENRLSSRDTEMHSVTVLNHTLQVGRQEE